VTSTPRTIGLLYAGELGAGLAALLRARGTSVVTTVSGRGEATAARARQLGLTVFDTVADVVRRSDVVLSVVPPSAADEVAAAYCADAHHAPPASIYVDVNSIGPELARSIAARVEACGRSFVDGAVNGLAANLVTGGTLFLSGTRSTDVAACFEGAMRVRVLGEQPGHASATKMLLSGLSKGVSALFLELAVLAERRGMLGDFMAASSEIYPGITDLARRMLPTYAQHADRRVTEMNELEATATASELRPCVIAAVRHLHEQLAEALTAPARSAGPVTAASMIETLAAHGLLAKDATAARAARPGEDHGQ
jgi:3-hydroxyisobutyrate dehydrogenase-like beta-hydroxyacid dehydrogenase